MNNLFKSWHSFKKADNIAVKLVDLLLKEGELK